MKQLLPIVAAASLLAAINLSISNAHAQGTAFTYQGQLQNNGSPASGTYNFQFSLYTTNTSGTPIAVPVTNNAVAVTNGLFTVTMDFGASVWNGHTNWLQIAVETNGAGSFSALSPRQILTPTPYAIFAQSVGSISASQLGSIGNGNFFIGPSGNLTTTGNGNTSIGVQALQSNTSGSQNTAEGDGALLFNSSGTGNTANGDDALTSNGSGTDNVANGARALESNQSGNQNTANGVEALQLNVNGNYNTANGFGTLNQNFSGSDNTADGYGALNVSVSGNFNTAVGDSSLGNLGFNGAGGTNNIAVGYNAGSAFTGNESDNIDIGNIGVGGENDIIRIGTPGIQTTVYIAGMINGDGGGLTNLNASQVLSAGSSQANFFLGPAGNPLEQGLGNTAMGSGALTNNELGIGNTALGAAALQNMFAGTGNTAIGLGADAFFVSGNDNTAIGGDALIGASATAGGTNNIALGFDAGSSFQGTESYNIDIGNIGHAGDQNIIRIGSSQTATYLAGSVGIATTAAGELLQIGSNTNQADGIIRLGCGNGTQYRTWDVGVPYGGANTSGTNYSFIIRDDSAGSTRFMIDYANGDVCIGTNTALGLLTVGTAYCTGTTWQNGSDRNSKKDFSPVNPQEVLAKVASLPITQWQYKVEGAGIEHLGPMAQDFHTAFGLNGSDDKHISTVDEGGVALAAIQGLNQKLEEQNAENAELKRQNDSLAEQLDELKAEVKLLAQRTKN